jgi:hypothetical protein
MTKPSSRNPPTCFVIGPIGDRRASQGSEVRTIFDRARETYDRLIVPGCSPFGIRPIRADDIAEPGEIPSQIFHRLRDSDLVIADLTTGNANVMYELGLRHGQGKVTLQLGESSRLPFDVSIIRTIQFIRSDSGYAEAVRELRNAIRAALRDGMLPLTATRIFRRSSARIKFIATLLDVTREPSLLLVRAEIDSAFAHIRDHLLAARENFRALDQECRSAQFEITTSSSAAEDPARTIQGFLHRIEPGLSNVREDLLGLDRNLARIDRVFMVGLSLLKLPRDHEVVRKWRRGFSFLLRLMKGIEGMGARLRIGAGSLHIVDEETDPFHVAREAGRLPQAWIRNLDSLARADRSRRRSLRSRPSKNS